jgi:8-oxo-dGTP pyrophosphatase MutT (NUDIX family)
MPGFSRQSGAIQFLDEDATLTFAEVPEPALPPEHEAAMNDLWQQWVDRNPMVFDGPVAAVTAIAERGPRRIELSWTRTTYRRHVLREIPGAQNLMSLFVAVVQPTPAGVLLGRMAAWTASGRPHWVLPGGTMEPPAPGQALEEDLLRAHAARELAEETGLDTSPADLTRWAVVRNPEGKIGFFYHAPQIPEATVRQRFTTHLSDHHRRGEQPELTHIQFAETPRYLDALDGPLAATLPALLAHYAGVTEPG